MKTIIFSDTHLNTHFSHRKYLFLKSIIDSADRVIINGDLWDGYKTSFKSFINSKWKKLLDTLAKKDTVYIWGNHDKERHMKKEDLWFCNVLSDYYEFKSGTKTYLVMHGNQITPALDDLYEKYNLNFMMPISQWIDYRIIRRNMPIIVSVAELLPFKVVSGRNRKFKKYLRDLNKPNTILVTGHSHYAEIDLKNRYANCGFIKWGYGTYLEIEESSIKLVKCHYS